jgi:hypothetical protein
MNEGNDPDEVSERFDDTEAIDDALPLDDEWQYGQPRFTTREVMHTENNEAILVVRSAESRPVKIGRLRKRRQYRVVTEEITLQDNSRVEGHLATSINFKPVSGETTIHCLMRLSWWSHGPAQIGLVLFGIIGTLVLGVLALRSDTVPFVVFVLAFALLWITVGVAYFIVWMKWAYKYLIVTDMRIGLVYSPPFSLPGVENFAPIADITTSTADDQSWAANLLGKINPAYRFGIISADTPAQKDEWINEIRFVREHGTVNEVLSGLILARDVHTESDDDRDARELQNTANTKLIAWLDEQSNVG